ncbi:unnamed protein product [Kuraishia capsulata CBS 1993]|uniref:Zn(2)-C6 fungal-type domain-containing protein n=1 Tax=Kuraishia capsulata CBS 1993 TaxID=1382522 RepID=W6MKC4_9ASCO|nr:uncharacterized protein KUCA_T00001069001 [Kuraishia capsulata CBS 1993]CDK25102.1 unnamed protein product [Kuraishia capsulata CBS 1993]
MSQVATAKKYKCCTRCRSFKLRCDHDPLSNPVVCKTCQAKGLECVFEDKINEKQMIQTINTKLERIDNIVGKLVSHLSKGGAKVSKESIIQSLTQGLEFSPNQFSPSKVTTMSSPELEITPNKRKSSFDSDRKDTKKPNPNKKLTKKTEQMLLDFFTNNISRYLPVLIFEDMPKPTSKLRKDSPLLFFSTLSVASLYHTDHRDLHETFSAKFEDLARKLDPSSLNESVKDEALKRVLDDVLGLVIAGAWLGTEFGFRMSLLAGDILGRLLPEVSQELDMPDSLKKYFCSVGVGSYIVEQRLRIIHNRPIMPASKSVEYRARRDAYLPYFLTANSKESSITHKLSPSELKANANVELCTIIMSYQQQLTLNGINSGTLILWNERLNSWLADWLGKVVTSLRPSSYKPLLLTFHFAKLFLNSRVIQSTSLMHENPAAYSSIIALAQNSAVDILEMLINDSDMKRLISVSPVFYPTTFSTAAAFLLKLLKEAPQINHRVNAPFILDMIGKTYHLLNEVIDSPVLPCFETVTNLGIWFEKVSSSLRETQYSEVYRGSNGPDQAPKGREPVFVPPLTKAREQTPGFDRPYFNMTLSKSMEGDNDFSRTVIGQYQPLSTPMLTATSMEMPVFAVGDHESVGVGVDVEADDIYGNVWSFDNNDPNFLVDAQGASILDSLMEDMPLPL